MDRNSVIKLMRSYGASLITQPGDRAGDAINKTLATLYHEYGDTPNFGMVLGEQSNGLVAVIIDHRTPGKDC